MNNGKKILEVDNLTYLIGIIKSIRPDQEPVNYEQLYRGKENI